MNKNSENPGVGSAFQKAVARQFEQHYDKEFILEMKIAIGQPAKYHKFDIVSGDNTMAIECKCYTWTETGMVRKYIQEIKVYEDRLQVIFKAGIELDIER